MEKQMNTHAKNEESKKYYRFQVFHGEAAADTAGKAQSRVQKTKSIGMAYLKDGQNIFTLRLWMFSWDRYYLLPSKHDSSKYLVMTREPNRNPNAKNKYYWNIVGSGVADTVQGLIRLDFDLLSQPIYMSTHPESQAYSQSLPEPDAGEAFFEVAA